MLGNGPAVCDASGCAVDGCGVCGCCSSGGLELDQRGGDSVECAVGGVSACGWLLCSGGQVMRGGDCGCKSVGVGLGVVLLAG